MATRHVLATSGGNRELRAAPPYAPFGDSTPPPPSAYGGSSAGVTVNQDSAFGVAAVYSAIGILTDAVSSLPIRVLDSPPSMLATAKVLAPSALILQPYAEISRIDWICQCVASLALRGNFFGRIIEWDQNRYATQIKPIPPDNASVKRRLDGSLEYRYFNEIIPPAQVFHLKYLSMPGMLVGLNPIEYLRMTFALGLAQERYAEAFFRNSAIPGTVISYPGEVTPDEAAAAKKAWNAAFQGLNKASSVAIIGGDAKVMPLMMTFEDAQFLESRQLTGTQVAQLFRIPPHMLSQTDRTTSWGTGIEQQERGFIANTLQGYLSRIEEALTVLHPKGSFVNFDISARVRGDSMQLAQIGQIGMLGGYLTADEARAPMNLPPLPDGQGELTFMPSNSMLLEQAIDEFENPPDPPPAPMPFGQPPANGNTPAPPAVKIKSKPAVTK